MHPLLWNKTAAVDFQLSQTLEGEQNTALWHKMEYNGISELFQNGQMADFSYLSLPVRIEHLT